MNQQIFVPVTDDMIYNHPERIEGPLIPYYVGMECENWLSIEINPDESKQGKNSPSLRDAKGSSSMRLAYSS